MDARWIPKDIFFVIIHLNTLALVDFHHLRWILAVVGPTPRVRERLPAGSLESGLYLGDQEVARGPGGPPYYNL